VNHAPAVATGAEMRGRNGIILLVDNDPLQAFQRKSILERQFQEVERVGDAADALCLVSSHISPGSWAW